MWVWVVGRLGAHVSSEIVHVSRGRYGHCLRDKVAERFSKVVLDLRGMKMHFFMNNNVK